MKLELRVGICRSKCDLWVWVLLISIFGLTGCVNNLYNKTVPGELEGSLRVEWRKPNSFVYIPDPDNPLRFTRGENQGFVEPGDMWTDGGSIPRQFWIFKNYSPWGYGPAFIVHDWLFHMQDCELPGYEQYDLKTAAVIMAEVMKTLLEDPEFDYGSKQSIYLMYKAVQTKPARDAWEDRNCKPVERALPPGPPDKVFEVSF